MCAPFLPFGFSNFIDRCVLESGKEGDEDVISGFFKFSLPCLRVILHTGQPVDSDILLGITPGRVRNTKLMD